MGVAGSLVAGGAEGVVAIDVRRPKLGKLKGIFVFAVARRLRSATQCWVWWPRPCCRVLGKGSPAALVTKVTGRKTSACVGLED